MQLSLIVVALTMVSCCDRILAKHSPTSNRYQQKLIKRLYGRIKYLKQNDYGRKYGYAYAYGHHKDDKENLCDELNCLNGGVCYVDTNCNGRVAKCCCGPNYEGPLCENQVTACTLYLCQNNGECQVNDLGLPECNCPDGFGGLACEIPCDIIRPCPDEFVELPPGSGNCYYACNASAESWLASQAICVALGATLWEPNTNVEFDTVVNYLNSKTMFEVSNLNQLPRHLGYPGQCKRQFIAGFPLSKFIVYDVKEYRHACFDVENKTALGFQRYWTGAFDEVSEGNFIFVGSGETFEVSTFSFGNGNGPEKDNVEIRLDGIPDFEYRNGGATTTPRCFCETLKPCQSRISIFQ